MAEPDPDRPANSISESQLDEIERLARVSCDLYRQYEKAVEVGAMTRQHLAWSEYINSVADLKEELDPLPSTIAALIELAREGLAARERNKALKEMWLTAAPPPKGTTDDTDQR